MSPLFYFLIFNAALLVWAHGSEPSSHDVNVSFRPRELPRKVATCQALNRAADKVQAIQIHYVEVNPEASQSILMVHGWPGLWHNWKYQIEEFKDDFHLIIPDLRGFGASTFPDDVESSGQMQDLISDLVCVLEDAHISETICMGHDWGSQTCYEAARMRPDLFNAVVGSVVPYLPSADDFVPIRLLLSAFPKLSYQIFFSEETPRAIAELNSDIARTLRATIRGARHPPPDAFLRDTASYIKAYDDIELQPISFFTLEEEEYWIEQYSIQKFDHNLYLYTHSNRYGSWKFSHSQGNATIPQPVLSILPSEDPVADWVQVARLLKSADYIPNLTTKVMYGSHWVQLDNPVEFNQAVREWLRTLAVSKDGTIHESHVGHASDEL